MNEGAELKHGVTCLRSRQIENSLVSALQTRSSWMLVFKDREMLGESENCISFVGIHSWIVTNMRKRSINIDQSFQCWVIRSFYIHVSWSKLSVHWQYHQMYFWDNTVQLIIDWPRTSLWCRRSFRINLNSFFVLFVNSLRWFLSCFVYFNF